jgi:hypothetical protein
MLYGYKRPNKSLQVTPMAVIVAAYAPTTPALGVPELWRSALYANRLQTAPGSVHAEYPRFIESRI